ncbi:MAG: AAA family ATPase [Magnetococcales bacterium]|nr:AAA family ATPase [Magnetococcales bacterium]
MDLKQLHIRDFRNIVHAELTFDPTLNLITGSNGQGKSNLLEAIGLLSTGRSFRHATAGHMRRHNQPWFCLNGQDPREFSPSHSCEVCGVTDWKERD